MPNPYIELPLDRIIDVHFGGGIVIAVVPGRLENILSLDPADPDEKLTSGEIYDENQTIPVEDYTTKPVNTTANLVAGVPTINGIADTDLLVVDKTYKISGTGIPANTTMRYDGGGSGTMSDNATENIPLAPVVIRINIWRFDIGVRMPPGPEEPPGTPGSNIFSVDFTAEEASGDSTYFSSPLMLFRSPPLSGLTDEEKAAEVDAAYEDALTHNPAYALYRYYRSTDPADYLHNGVNLGPFTFSLWRFVQVEQEHAAVYILNMDFAKLVQVNQIVYEEPYHPGHPGNNFIPGYLPGGTKLTGYSSGVKLSLTATPTAVGGWGNFYSLVVKAQVTDPSTGAPIDAKPLWTAQIPPMESSPASMVELKRFNAGGIVTLPPP